MLQATDKFVEAEALTKPLCCLYQVLQAKDKFVEAEALETELEEEIEGMLARITEAEALLRRKAEMQRQRMADLREGQVYLLYWYKSTNSLQRCRGSAWRTSGRARFTCFTGTKVQIVYRDAEAAHGGPQGGPGAQ